MYIRGGSLKLVLSGIFVLGCICLYAQDDQSKPPPSTKAQKREAAMQKDLQKRKEKATKEALKQHMKDQTPAVRKRMKEDAHKANLNNEHKREFFLKRWFSKKKKK